MKYAKIIIYIAYFSLFLGLNYLAMQGFKELG